MTACAFFDFWDLDAEQITNGFEISFYSFNSMFLIETFMKEVRPVFEYRYGFERWKTFYFSFGDWETNKILMQGTKNTLC